MEIKGKTAIITGSTGKLARTIVLSLAQAGADCVCLYNKNESAAKILESDIKKNGVRSFFISADLTKPQDIEKVFAVIKNFSQPQILINAASVFDKKPLENVTADYLKQVFDINFSAAMLMTQKFIELCRQNNHQQKPIAKIINFTDATIEKHPKRYSVYIASKAALASATISLAKELAPDFTVNAVAPGLIHWQEKITEDQKKKMLSAVPAARTGLPEEVASAIKFVIENDYINARTVTIDGGWTA